MLFLIVFKSDISARPNLFINWLNKAPWSIINNLMIKKILFYVSHPVRSQKYDDLKTTDSSTVKQFFLKLILVILSI